MKILTDSARVKHLLEKTLVEQLKENSTILLLRKVLGESKSYGDKLLLAGGAVVDILEGRNPKDFDFVNWGKSDLDKFRKAGFKHTYTTKSSITMEKDGIIIQFISFELKQFGFKIEQSTYDIVKEDLTIDEDSFTNKVLIPVNFDDFQNLRSAVFRIPHWVGKGYHIPDITYLSLMSCTFGLLAASKHKNS